jgi:hypothetical protein
MTDDPCQVHGPVQPGTEESQAVAVAHSLGIQPGKPITEDSIDHRQKASCKGIVAIKLCPPPSATVLIAVERRRCRSPKVDGGRAA